MVPTPMVTKSTCMCVSGACTYATIINIKPCSQCIGAHLVSSLEQSRGVLRYSRMKLYSSGILMHGTHQCSNSRFELQLGMCMCVCVLYYITGERRVCVCV